MDLDDIGGISLATKESNKALDTKASTLLSSVISVTRYRDLEIPLDYQYLSITTISDLQLIPEPRPMGKRRILLDGRDLFFTRAIRLNNNHLIELKGLNEFICDNILNPEALSWIDLSFNSLIKIDPVFCNYPALRILYLHGNSIGNLNEVDKLQSLAKLKKLSLHGNPIENDKQYKMYVLSQLPQLTNFDMTTLTRGDRVTAATWKANMPAKSNKASQESV